MADEVQQPSPEVRRVIRELEGCYSHAGGPKHEAAYASVFTMDSEPEKNDISAHIDVNFSEESPYGDTGSSRKSFTLTLADVRYLAENAPELKESFGCAAQKMDEQLQKDREPILRAQREKEHAENVLAVGTWADQGLPTQTETQALRPLKFRGRGFIAW